MSILNVVWYVFLTIYCHLIIISMLFIVPKLQEDSHTLTEELEYSSKKMIIFIFCYAALVWTITDDVISLMNLDLNNNLNRAVLSIVTSLGYLQDQSDFIIYLDLSV